MHIKIKPGFYLCLVGVSLWQESCFASRAKATRLLRLMVPLYPDNVAGGILACCLGLSPRSGGSSYVVVTALLFPPPSRPMSSSSALPIPSLLTPGPPTVLAPFMPRHQLEAYFRVPQRGAEDLVGSRTHHALVLYRRPASAVGFVAYGGDTRGQGGRSRPAGACSCA